MHHEGSLGTEFGKRARERVDECGVVNAHNLIAGVDG